MRAIAQTEELRPANSLHIAARLLLAPGQYSSNCMVDSESVHCCAAEMRPVASLFYAFVAQEESCLSPAA